MQRAGFFLVFFLLLNTLLSNCLFEVGIKLYLSDFFVLALLGFAAVCLRQKETRDRARPWLLVFAVLLVYYTFLMLCARYIQESSLLAILDRFRNLFIYPLLFLAGLVCVIEREDVKWLVWAVRFHVLISVLYGLFCLALAGTNPATVYFRGVSIPASYFMLVNHGTAVLCCLVFVFEFVSVAVRRRRFLSASPFLAASLAGIIGSQHRSTIVVFGIMILLVCGYGIRAEKAVRKRVLYGAGLTLLLVTAISLAMFLPSVNQLYKKRIAETKDTVSGRRSFFNTNLGIRVGRTVATLREWSKYPILGCGWGRQMKEFKIYDLKGHYVRSVYGTSHNYYVTILYQTGIIGFAVMMVFFGKILQCSWPRGKLAMGKDTVFSFFIFLIGLLVFNGANTLMDSNPVTVPIFFMLLGAAVSHAVWAGKDASRDEGQACSAAQASN